MSLVTIAFERVVPVAVREVRAVVLLREPAPLVAVWATANANKTGTGGATTGNKGHTGIGNH